MPGKVKVKIISGRNLPVMDRSSDTTDAYVEIKLGSTTYKTDVCRKSLHPKWNSEWYRFEVDDSELQDEPLQIRLMDHDTYSANDAIGKVYIDLNPLLLPAASLLVKYNWNGETSTNRETTPNSVMSGWIPVYDTMHGIRGEVNVTVKVELFSDSNKFRQSSCGVQFFCSKTIPHGYYAQVIHGFVEELVVNDDPEYQWIDKIRTPRASNEARQTLFFKLSGELQRKIGVKTLDLGGNAVIGYSQCFDLEGESGIVARGIGTAVTLVKLLNQPISLNIDPVTNEERSLSYLQFLSFNKSFRLNTASDVHNLLSPFLKTKPTESAKPKTFDSCNDPTCVTYKRKQFTRHLSHTDFNNKPQLQTQMQHSSSLQTLLKQEDNRGIPGYGFSQRIKNFKYSSQNMLSKKVIALKAKLGETGTSECLVKAHSVSELVERRKSRFRHSNSDSSVMAELLVRSIMQGQKSLGCILEDHDNISPPKLDILEVAHSSSECTPLEYKQTDVSDSYLSIPYSSLYTHSSNDSCSDSSSSEEEEEDENQSDSAENSLQFDTVSNIVKNVEIIERKLSLNSKNIDGQRKDQFVLPEAEIYFENDSVSQFAVNLSDKGSVANDENINEILDDFITEETNKDDINDEELNINIDNEPHVSRNINELLPPFAEAECFNIDHSDEEARQTCDTEQNMEQSDLEHPLSSGKSTENTKLDSKLIIPPVMIGANIKSSGLVKTAMQTMLLEKVNIMGTYTPPTSPTSVDKHAKPFNLSLPGSATSSPPSAGREESFFPRITKTYESVRRSPTAISLSEISSDKQSVLGAPFVSLHNIQCGKSDTSLNFNTPLKPNSEEQISKTERPATERCGKSEEFIPRSSSVSHKIPAILKHKRLGSLRKSDDLKRTISVDHLFRKKLGFLRKKGNNESFDRRRSEGPAVTVEDVTSKSHDRIPDFLIHLFHKKQKDNPAAFRHNKGLLNAALKSVAMETVQDILATSHGNEPKQTDKSRFIPFSSSAVLNTSNDVTTSSIPSLSNNTPANTEIDKGSCVSSNKMHASLTPDLRNQAGSPVREPVRAEPGHQRTESVGTKMSQSPAKLNSIPCIHRRSSDSDLSITPKGNSLTGSDRSCGAGPTAVCPRPNTMMRSAVHQDNFDMLEYPFLTMSKYPPGFIMYLGGAVSARSVKLLERITNLEEPESRDIWWSELRMEIRSHARALNCNAVLGYTEITSICEDVCVLSASGTAAVIGFQHPEVNDTITNLPVNPKPPTSNKDISCSLDHNDFEKDKQQTKTAELTIPNSVPKSFPESPEHDSMPSQLLACTICHLPYNGTAVPLGLTTFKCVMCRNGKVPDVLIATIEIPDGIPVVGRGCFLQACVCRPLRDLRGESNAKEISDGLPFLEYELHRVLVSKLKIKGMNAIFGLKVRISIGERMLIGIANGTAIFLAPLSPPPIPTLVSDHTDEKKLVKLQKHVHDTVKKNKEIYQIKHDEVQNGRILSDNEDSEDEQALLDLSTGNKDCCILEMDDPEDAEVLNLLMETCPPDGFHVVNTEFVPGLEELEIVKNLQMFTQIWRAKVQTPCNLDKHFQRLLQSVYFKLRRMIPCALCDLQFRIDLPEPDEIQLCVLGMALGLGDSLKHAKYKRKTVNLKRSDDELIFNLEEDQIPENSVASSQPSSNQLHAQTLKHRPKSPQRNRFNPIKQRHMPYRERHGVDITPLSYVPGGKIEKYLGNLNFFFIRETTSIREEGGLSGFVHSFITEVLAIVRAHVTALGGNAMVAYFMTECILNHNLHKNQGQCLINVGGDVVFVSYFNDDP